MAFKTDGGPISRQIEQTANLYSPSVYSLLSFYHALATESDPLDLEFIPLTTITPRAPRETKIFAVGLIPPPAVVSNAILDRSASTQALEGSYNVLIAENPDVGSSSNGDLLGETGGISTSTTVPVGPTSTPAPVGPKQQGLTDDFYMQYVVMCNRLGCQPEELARVIQTESSWIPHNTAESKRTGQVVAKGLIQFIKKTAVGLGMSEEEYATFETLPAIDQLPWMEKFYKGRAKGRSAAELKRITFGGFNNPDGSIYNSRAKPPEFKRSEFQHKAYADNEPSDGPPKKGYITADDLFKRLAKKKVNPDVLAGIQKAKDRLGMGPNSPFRTEEAPTPDDWNEVGRPNAGKASRTASQVANKDLNQTNLGKRFMDAQWSTAILMRLAIERMGRTPPLRMLVNPQSFRVSAEKVISSGNWGRNGPIIEHWGENQDKIEGSGKIAGFYSMDANDATGPGLTRTARQFSASYQNLLSLFLLYKNNGGVWFLDPTVPASDRAVTNLSIVGSVYLYYDEILYIGSFDSLSLTEAAESPFTLDYSFSFTVRAWYLLDHLDDSQYTYRQNVPPSLPTGTGGSPLTGGNRPQPSPEVGAAATYSSKILPENDPTFGINEGDIGDDLEGIG